MQGHAVFGIYSNRKTVEEALAGLKSANFRNSDVSILAPENLGDFHDIATVRSSKAPEGTVTGAVCGAILGGLFCWLVSMGILPIPGLEALVAAGPVLAALTGVGSGGIVGGIIGAILGFRIPEFEAKRYESRVRKGGILLSVHTDNNEWTDRARKILKESGASEISVVGEHKAA